MTTIAPGANATVTIANGGEVTVATNGGYLQVVETPTVGPAKTHNLGPKTERRTFGPYALGASVLITNQTVDTLVYIDTEVGTSQTASVSVGSPSTITLGDQGFVKVATNGGYWQSIETPAVGAAVTTIHGPATSHRQFGPFAVGATVQLSNLTCDTMLATAVGSSATGPLPQITTAAVITAAVAGSAPVYTNAASTSTPAPTITYFLLKNGSTVASGASAIAAYTSTVASDVLVIRAIPSNVNGTGSAVDSAGFTVTASAALRFATASNQFGNGAGTFNLGTGAAQTDLLVNASHTFGQDITTAIQVCGAMQWIHAATGISNVGNAANVAEMALVYNGTNVAVTSGSLTAFTIADVANWFSDGLLPAVFGGAVKFTKGTTINLRVRFRSSAPTTDKYPLGRSGHAGVEQIIYLDPAKQTITNGVLAQGSMTYANKSFAVTSASASGTTVTLIMDTTNLVSGTTYTVAGATGTGNQLFYNTDPATITVTLVGGAGVGTATYTATSGAPSATATGSLTVAGKNGRDANFGTSLVPLFIVANHSKPSVAIFGDSKTFGTGDTMPTVGVLGMSRILFTDTTLATSVQCSGMNFGCPSGVSLEVYTATAGGSVANFEAWYAMANYAVVGYGTNGTVTANQTTMYGRLRAKGITPIVQRSLTPRTSVLGSDPVSITSLTTDTVTTTVTGTMADTSGLINGQSYPISGATPAAYNGTFAITVVNGTTFTYTAASSPGSSATGTLLLDDQWRTTQYQTTAAGWSNGGAADTFEIFLRGNIATDANFAYYQSQGERANATAGSAGYWQWGVNGTAKYMTSDGLHEGGATGIGYEQSCGVAGTITTQAGGTVSRSLRAHVATFT